MLNIRYKDNCEDTARRWRAYWAGDVLDRPVVVGMRPVRENADGFIADTTYRRVNALRTDADVKAMMDDYEKEVSQRYWLGETIPSIRFQDGTDAYASFFGAKLHVSTDPRVDTTWVDPLVKDGEWSSFDASIKHGPDSAYDRYMHIHSVAREYAAGKYLISSPDCHSNMDAISALRGPQGVCFDLMDCPDEVMTALQGVERHYAQYWKDFRENAGSYQTGHFGNLPAYCEEEYATIQCDFLALIGPEHANRFVFPALEKEIANHKHTIFHLDGTDALRHLDTLLSLDGIDTIQWVPGVGKPRSIERMEVFHRIQAAGKGLCIHDWHTEEIKAHFKELRPEKVFFSAKEVKTREEGEELLEYLKTHM